MNRAPSQKEVRVLYHFFCSSSIYQKGGENMTKFYLHMPEGTFQGGREGQELPAGTFC